jgi:hypothetical protein
MGYFAEEPLIIIRKIWNDTFQNILLIKQTYSSLYVTQWQQSKLINLRWWKDLYNEDALNYSRDRVVECYLWSYTAYYEKEYSRARMILAKLIAVIILTDDTYDVRATLEECRKFNEAIQRLECSSNLINMRKQSISSYNSCTWRCNFLNFLQMGQECYFSSTRLPEEALPQADEHL